MRSGPSALRTRAGAAWIVVVVAAGMYWNALGNDFAYDDIGVVVENEAIHDVATLPGALTRSYWPELADQTGLWRPVTTLALGLQWTLLGDNPVFFHLTNLVVHAAVSGLVTLLLTSLMPPAAALAGGLVFAVHPVHVEAVANVVGLGELLAALWFLLACILHLRGPDRSGWGRSLAVGLLYALAMGSKESAITLPGALFVLDAARERLLVRDLVDYVRRRWLLYVVLVGVAAVMLWARVQILGSVAQTRAPLGLIDLTELPRIWTLTEVWGHWVRLMVFPLDLSADYSPGVIPLRRGWHVLNAVGLVLALGVLAGALLAWRRGPTSESSPTARAAGFGVVWFLVTISPTSNALFLSGVMLAERTLYLPSVGLAAVAGWLVLRLSRPRPRVAWTGLVVVVLLMGTRTWFRTPTWRSTQSVFEVLIRDFPHSGRAQWVMGNVLFDAGDPEGGDRAMRLAAGLLGSEYLLHMEWAGGLLRAGWEEEATRVLAKAHAIDPGKVGALLQMAFLKMRQEDLRGAEIYALRGLAQGAEGPDLHLLLAEIYSLTGRPAEAARERRRAIQEGQEGVDSIAALVDSVMAVREPEPQ